MRSFVALPAAMILAALPSACGDADARTDAAAEPVVRDSAGITIVENPAPDDSTLPELRLATEPMLEIGMLDGPRAYQLDGVAGAVRLSDGTLVVGDGGSRELRWFDAGGRHVRSVGGQGEGPGEFRTLASLHAGADDAVHAWDGSTARLTTFDRDGNRGRIITYAEPSPMMTRIAGVHPEGYPIHRGDPNTAELRGEDPGERRDTAAFVLIDADGQPADTLARLPGEERVLFQDGSAWGTRSHLFGRDAHFASASDGFVAATSDAFEVRIFGWDGELRQVIRLAAEPDPPAREEVEALRGRRMRAIEEQDQSGSGLPPEMVERFRRASIESVQQAPVAERKATFDKVALASQGALRIRLPAPPGEEDADALWLLFDTEGRLEGRLRLANGTRLLQVGDGEVLVVETDDFDVEYVRMYELIEPEAAS